MLRNNKVINDNKCFILLYIYHLVQGIMLWISQNPLWASLHSHQISNRSNTEFCLLQKIWGISQTFQVTVLFLCSTHSHTLSVCHNWRQQKTPKNNSHVNSHFSSWCLLLTKKGVRISDNMLFTTQCEILMPATIQKKN